MERKVDRRRRADHWIYLDRTWARRLGIHRTAGLYRIRSRDLARRLAGETLWVDAAGTVHACGAEPAAASATGARSVNHSSVNHSSVNHSSVNHSGVNHSSHHPGSVPVTGSYE